MQQQLGRLSDLHVRLFLAIVLRNSSVFDQFAEQLAPTAFVDGGLRLVWQAALLRRQISGRIPVGPELLADIAATPDASMTDLNFSEHLQSAHNFVLWAYDPRTFLETAPNVPEMEQFAFQIGRLLLLRAQSDTLLQALPGTELGELPTVLEQAQLRASAAAALDSTGQRQPLFVQGWDTNEPHIVHTTGFPFLDRYMGGGETKGEAYTFMAPMGTCKTTFAVMKWVTAGRQAYVKAFEPGYDGRIGLSVFVSYEASLNPELRHRSLSFAARIHKDRLQAMGGDGLQALSSDPDRPLPYELNLFPQEIADGLFLPERARIEAELGWMNTHLVCLDMTGADKAMPYAGRGGVPELVHRLNGLLRAPGASYYIQSVVIDYLGLLVDRYQNNLPARAKVEPHKAYQEAVDVVRNLIAKPFECPVWLTHQLSGAANSILNVTRRIHHTDAKGSKSAVENADFAFVVGNLTSESIGVLDCTKHRRYRPMPRTVIRVEGDINNIVSLDNHLIDSRGQIVDRATMAAAGAGTPRSAPRIAAPVDEDDDFAEIRNG